ncbi:hypothetical protein LIPSTDRAFT_202093 [Lipomyces starkeyi NRRL Y-11557]|uniref:Uncharacterized protein n=1 Tax=Lipomyces starkeyi NRRL Y-11557 TaxID=675824 RepID=A0A1E3PV61_LIPST|nr:hypothetical protein LIPSTDRAFT_202093 [Lipomyces starkeyi NRRL Y-11557]
MRRRKKHASGVYLRFIQRYRDTRYRSLLYRIAYRLLSHTIAIQYRDRVIIYKPAPGGYLVKIGDVRHSLPGCWSSVLHLLWSLEIG